jgi:hypothetical protein
MIIYIKETPKDLLNEGKHDVTISQIWEGTAPSGSDYFEPLFQNEHGYVRGRLYNTEKSMPRIIEIFKACGLKTEQNSSIDTNSLIGKRLCIFIEKKEREGKLFLDVVRYEKCNSTNDEISEHHLENKDDLPF